MTSCIWPPPTLILWMIGFFVVGARWKDFSVIALAILIVVCKTSRLVVFVVFVLFFLCDLAWKAPFTNSFCLTSLLCSCASSDFNNFAKVMLDKSFEFSKYEIIASNFSGIMTITFGTILELEKSIPRSLTLLTMPRSLLEYSLIVYDSFIFCISNSLIKFSICISLTLSFPSYSCLKKSQILLVVFRVIILENMVDETATNKVALAFDFICFLFLWFLTCARVGLSSRGGTSYACSIASYISLASR